MTSSPTRRDRLAAARLYLCTDGRRGRGDLRDFLEEVLGGGVDVVQLREKHLEAADELALLDVVREACHRHGALFAVNDRADLARISGADVLHVGRRDLTPAQARAVVGPDVVIGRSSHSPGQAAEAADDPDVDYYCIGPVRATPTKPGRAATGPGAVRAVAERAAAHRPGDGPDGARPRPWFAIGGIDAGCLDEVTAAGARRVVVVRALTEAADPRAAARELATRLAALA